VVLQAADWQEEQQRQQRQRHSSGYRQHSRGAYP
jgi:hypothetical protein